MRLGPSVRQSVGQLVRNAFFRNLEKQALDDREPNELWHGALWRPLIIPFSKIICPISKKIRWTHLCSDRNLFSFFFLLLCLVLEPNGLTDQRTNEPTDKQTDEYLIEICWFIEKRYSYQSTNMMKKCLHKKAFKQWFVAAHTSICKDVANCAKVMEHFVEEIVS